MLSHNFSVGRSIDSTMETIDDLGLSIISMVFFFKLSIVFNSVNAINVTINVHNVFFFFQYVFE